jgi:RNA-binding motif protein, X-linked 2
MNAIRQTQALNQRELDNCIPPEASWHRDYADTAFIYIGGLDPELSEGDIVTIFSQYGEPVYINLVRDKETGVSKGFAFLKYEDQRSCDLAVDNLGGASVRGRLLRVDHARYKPHENEDITRDNTKGSVDHHESEEDSRHRHRRIKDREDDTEEEGDLKHREEKRPRLKEEEELERLVAEIDDEDPMKGDLVARKQKEVDRALRKLKSHRSHDDKNKYRNRSRSRSPRRRRSRSREDDRYREKRRRRSKSPS